MKEGAFMYETKKLYYEDVYKKEFTAKVLECRESKKGYEIILNQTAFRNLSGILYLMTK